MAYDNKAQYLIIEEDWVQAMAPINVAQDAPTRVRALGDDGWRLVSAYIGPYVGPYHFPVPVGSQPALAHTMHFQRAPKTAESAQEAAKPATAASIVVTPPMFPMDKQF